MYPVSSKIDIMKKSRRIFGRKMATPPTPPIMPSMRSDLKIPFGRMNEIAPLNRPTPVSIHRMGKEPTLKVT